MNWKVFLAMVLFWFAIDWAFPSAQNYIFCGAIGTLLLMAVIAGFGQMFGRWP